MLLYTGDMARQSAMSETGLGTVIWFDPKAGYGFVKPDDGGPDMFVRRSAKRGAVTILAAGERV
jgi:CspA family cold shock protein